MQRRSLRARYCENFLKFFPEQTMLALWFQIDVQMCDV